MTATTQGISALRGTRSKRVATTDGIRGERLAAAAGVAFVVLNVAGTFLPGAPPASDASSAKIAAVLQRPLGSHQWRSYSSVVSVSPR